MTPIILTQGRGVPKVEKIDQFGQFRTISILNPLPKVNKPLKLVEWLDHGQRHYNILAKACLKAGLVTGRAKSVIYFIIGMCS